MTRIISVLKQLSISYQKHQHPAVFTVEESDTYFENINAAKSKNLFLRNKKGDTHYLVVAKSSTEIDLKQLATQLEETRLSFASEQRLYKYLQVTPGSVSPFGLIHDKNCEVLVVVDNDLIEEESQAFHPNINTATLVITTNDFKKFLEWSGNTVRYLDL